MPRTPWFIDVSDPDASSFLESIDRDTRVADIRFPRGAHLPLTVYLVEKLHPAQNGRLYKEVDLATWDTLRIGVGLIDQAPTGGTWSLSVNGTTTGMTALDYNVSASSLQTLISAV